MNHDLARLKAGNLETFLAGGTTECDVCLSSLEDAAKVNLDSLEGLTLRFVDGEGPRENKRDLLALGLDFAVGKLDLPCLRLAEQMSFASIGLHETHQRPFPRDGDPAGVFVDHGLEFLAGVDSLVVVACVSRIPSEIGLVFSVVIESCFVHESDDASDGSVHQSVFHVFDKHHLGAFLEVDHRRSHAVLQQFLSIFRFFDRS